MATDVGSVGLTPRELFTRGDYAAAIDVCTERLASRPGDVEACKLRGAARRRLGKTSEAFADLNRAVQLDPQDWEVWYERGQARRVVGDLVGAVDDLTAALERNPDAEQAYWGRGYVRGDLNDFTGAVDDFTRYLSLDANNSDAWLHRGWALRQLGRFDEAVSDLNRAVELNPQNGNAHWNRADVWYARKELTKALADYRRAAALSAEAAEKVSGRIRELETALGEPAVAASRPQSTLSPVSPSAAATAKPAKSSKRLNLFEMALMPIWIILFTGVAVTFLGLAAFAIVKGVDVLYAGEQFVENWADGQETPTGELCKGLFCRRTDTTLKHVAGSHGRQSETFAAFCPAHQRSDYLVFLDFSHFGTMTWHAYSLCVLVSAIAWAALVIGGGLALVGSPALVILNAERRKAFLGFCISVGLLLGAVVGLAAGVIYVWW